MKRIFNAYSTPLIFFVLLLSISGILTSATLTIVYAGIFLRQLITVLIGFIVMFIFSFFNHRILEKLSKIIFIFTLLLLSIVLFHRHIARFIDLGLFSIQPSQFASIALTLLIARIFRDERVAEDFPKVFLLLFFLIVIVSLLVAFEPDMGSAAQIFLTGFVLLVVVGMKSAEVFIFGLLSIIGTIALIPLNAEWRRRIEAFLHPEQYKTSDAFQMLQSLRAFARGGITGVGFMRGIFKYPSVLPVSISDFVLPVIGEEFGAVFVIIVVLIYLIVAYVGFKIASISQSNFSRIVALGLTLSILFWAMINIAVSIGLMPTTGVPLPFVSFGGNNMLANFISVGILINISRKEVEG